MASQIAHIIYAQKYFEKYPSVINKERFLLGCVFPDIRRLAQVSRKVTHGKFPELNLDFSGLSSFEAGWKFHLYCDMKREEILNKYGFFGMDHAQDYYGNPDKLLEDELVYADYNNWEKIISLFNNAPELEAETGVKQDVIGVWYALLAKYFSQKPNDKTIKIYISKLPYLGDKSSEIVASIDKLRKNDKVIEILEKVKDEIV